jgi:putative transposase
MSIDNSTPSWQDDAALRRYQMIAPLLDEKLDLAGREQLRQRIARENNLSIRTIYRYESAFHKSGFQGLRPCDRRKQRHQELPENYDELLAQAIQLRREVPQRSISQIISILEMEGRVPYGVLKRSTLQRHMYQSGFGQRQLRTYVEARQSSSKRFCKPHRMMLIQGDIKYGLKLPIGKNGAKVQTYLSTVLDDHSRFILASHFYANQEAEIVEDTLRQAIENFGKFDACYFDNGKQYVAKQLKISLSRLGIRVCNAPIRSGKSKGKVEKFHQVVDSFLREVKLKRPKALDELNHLWDIYLDEYYQQKPHDGIREYYKSLGISVPDRGITPLEEFNRDKRPLIYLDRQIVAEAFRHHTSRRVDRGACISFQGRRYETKPGLIGFDVDISYDPAAPETIMISGNGITPFEAHPLRIKEFCDKSPAIPVSLLDEAPKTSRMLDALEKRHEQTVHRRADAISFASYGKDGDRDV